MNAKDRWNRLSLFWKVYLLLALRMILVVTFGETVLESLAGSFLRDFSDGYHGWHEAVLWAVSIRIPALAIGFVVARVLTDKLGTLSNASRSIAQGNLTIRIPVSDASNDAFEQLARTIASYQCAYDLFTQRELTEDFVAGQARAFSL